MMDNEKDISPAPGDIIQSKSSAVVRPNNSLVGRGLEILEAVGTIEKSSAQTIADFLAEEGYRPKINGDGHIEFKSEGTQCIIIPYEDNTMHFKLSAIEYFNIHLVPIAQAEELVKKHPMRIFDISMTVRECQWPEQRIITVSVDTRNYDPDVVDRNDIANLFKSALHGVSYVVQWWKIERQKI